MTDGDSPQPHIPDTATDLHEALQRVFGFADFRPLQEDVVRTALAGRDVLVVMPTGSGKSLCFQLPAAITPGLTLVVSPLVALMRDQVDGLHQRTAFASLGAAYINSLQTTDEQRDVLSRLRAGQLRLLYVAPERFRSDAFVQALRSVPLARFVVDEAHCISEWGHDFRPDYLALREIVDSLGRPPLLAATATATTRVQESIIANLGMREPQVTIGGFNRPNLHLSVVRCKNDRERAERLQKALPKLAAAGGSGLIYVATRRQAEEVGALAARALAPLRVRAAAYHAGMDTSVRNQLQSQWFSGELPVLVATNAFGMGIDKPDVRFVVHYVYPESLESYYQEAGRAGRDGRKSRCVILYSFGDRRTREWFIENDALTPADVKMAHARLCTRSAQDTNYVPRTWWAQALDWGEVKARLAMAELERAGLIERLGERSDDTLLHIVRRDFPPQALDRIATDLERQREERYRRLNEMIAYCKTTACRRRTTLNYFGDREEIIHNGFCCDNCERQAKGPSDANGHAASPPAAVPVPAVRAVMPAAAQDADVYTILQGIDALRPRLGMSRLNKLMRGSTSQDVQRFKTDNCPLFGMLRGCTQDQVQDLLNTLLQQGWLHQAGEDDYFVISVTGAGREVWQQRQPIHVVLPIARPMRAPDDEETMALHAALRSWRRAEGVALNTPPNFVLSDGALIEIARLRPTSIDALAAIPGLGPVKLGQYAEPLLALTRGEAAPAAPPAASPPGPPVVRQVPPAEPEAPPPAPAAPTAPDGAPRRTHLAEAVKALPDSAVDTYVLLEEGFEVEEIAEQRELKNSTIWTHLEQIAQAGLLDPRDLDRIVPPDVRQRIEVAIDACPPGTPTKEVREKLNDEVDYGPIRCVAACRRLRQP